ncbi:class IV adenylate cyclase [Paludisphaera mucosa]|uniref:Class IV adenylate cyclase n=1 Tax=Paludisphaera mucosa TaxID=3030827 RepID=A0ABT6FCP9_9BACT|nr:class IV adenylate cyclase [Paludisphaera mucosa]MDG3005276.1 class IV adenylate cyclase [Paludisphaera mucosa]
MGYEVEVKYRDVDHDALRRALAALGAEERGTVDEEDSYLNHPARDFAVTNEAFRIRRVGGDNRVTYKGPKEAGPTKTREEIEIPFDAGPERHEQLARLFDRLGFRRVAVVRKRRTSFHLRFDGHDLETTLDRAEGLGDFAEVEALAHGRDDLPRAQQAVLGLAAKLGLTEVEPRSYLRMLLEKRRQARP